MSFNSAETAHPEVQVIVEFPLSWSRSFLADPSQRDELASAISSDIGSTMQTLGVPGVAVVSLCAVRDDELLPNRLIRIFVDGLWCPFPTEAWHFAWNYAAGYVRDEPVELLEIFDYLCATTEADRSTVDPHELLILACRAAIYEQPSALLGNESFSAYIDGLEFVATDPTREEKKLSPDTIRTALKEVLELGISIADTMMVDLILDQAEENRWGNPMLTERLIAELRPAWIGIRLRSDDLRTLTTIAGQSGQSTAFRSLRDRIYRQLGVNFPHFRFIDDNALKNNALALTINHLVNVPRIIGEFNQLFSSIENLLCMNGARFIHFNGIEDLLSAISDQFPALVNNVYSVYTIEEITSTLRILVKEDVSIRPIRTLLEGLLNVGFVLADPLSVTFDNLLVLSSEPAAAWLHKPDILAACLRVNMKRYITTKYTGLEQHIGVIEIDLDLEREFLQWFWGAHKDAPGRKNYIWQQAILDAIHHTLKAGGYHISSANIITSSEARMSLQKLVRHELPRLPVLAYQELLPDTVVEHHGCVRVPL